MSNTNLVMQGGSSSQEQQVFTTILTNATYHDITKGPPVAFTGKVPPDGAIVYTTGYVCQVNGGKLRKLRPIERPGVERYNL